MNKKELIDKITSKKEFSELPEKDVELAFAKFDKRENLNDYQKLKLTRNFLRKVFSSFSSRKLFGELKDKDAEWVLNKHKSTKERLEFYDEIYGKIFLDVGVGKKKEISVIDLGCGVNGFTLDKMENALALSTSSSTTTNLRSQVRGINLVDNLKKTRATLERGKSKLVKTGIKINYLGVEAVGQLVELVNEYFEKEKMKNARAVHVSLFEAEKIKKLILKMERPRVVFMFKIIDSLEDLERDYSKKLLNEIVPLVDMVVLSFATKSLGKRSRFSAQRGWIRKFIGENFNVLDDFEINGERYIVFEKR